MKSAMLLIPLVAMCLSGRVDDIPVTAEPLQGLRKVRVLLEPTPEYQAGESIIRTTIELRLRREGIEVIGDKDGNRPAGMPLVYANCNILYIDEIDHFLYSCCLAIHERAIIDRKPNVRCIATTWERGGIGIIRREKLGGKLRDEYGGLMDKFLNDYYVANPKKKK